MSRTPRAIPEAAIGNLLVLLAGRQHQPCPTRAEIIEATGIAKRRLAGWLSALTARGLIEIESRRRARAGHYRMRVHGGQWTEWTERRKPRRREQLMLEAAGGDA